jgi:CheY-like chemotaxis protein
LLDLRLPRVDGIEVLTRIKADSRLRHIPVIVLSTSEADPDVRAAYEKGASAYLSKPAEFNEYREVIRAFGQFWLRISRYAGD